VKGMRELKRAEVAVCLLVDVELTYFLGATLAGALISKSELLLLEAPSVSMTMSSVICQNWSDIWK